MSISGGESWEDLKIGNVSAYALAISPAAPDTLLAGTSAGVYKYVADSWVLCGLDSYVVTAIQAHPTQANLVVAGTTNGAYISNDGGRTWQAGPAELRGISIQSISFDINNPSLVYYTTEGHSVLRASVNSSN